MGTMRRIAIASQKGGVGKTTTAVNLAAGLGLAGRRCLLVDMDPQANASTGFGVGKPIAEGAADALARPDRAPDLVIRDVAPGVDILPSGGPMRAAEARLTHGAGGRGPLAKALRYLKDGYDFAIIDCPPSLGALTLASLMGCDSILIPMQCEFYAMEGLAQAFAAVRAIQSGRNPELKIEGILFTMFDTGAEIGAEVMDEVRSHFGAAVFDAVVPRDVPLAEAPSYGESIFEYDVRSRGARAYFELTREVLDSGEKEEAGPGA